MDKDLMVETLISASTELAIYIEANNAIIRGSINPYSETEPDTADYQTCQELLEVARYLNDIG